MTDLYVAHRRADKERVAIIRQALDALGVVLHADIEPKARGAAKAIREAAGAAKAVLVLWPDSILDPTENHAGLCAIARTAHETGRLVAARLAPIDTARLEPPFDALPTPDLSAWLAATAPSASEPAWQAVLVALGAIIGRPGLGQLAIAIAADKDVVGEPAQIAFARRHPDDPASATIWTRFETAERERFAAAFRKAHGVLVERSNEAQDRLKVTLDGFSAYLKAIRTDANAVPPDPKAALADGAAALRESVARLASDNERLQTALDRASQTPPAAANSNRPWKWMGISAAAFLVGSMAAAGITEFAGPLRGDAHPRIASLARVAQQRAEIASTSSAEIARLKEQARLAARRAETAEANLRNARTQLAHSQTELIQRQTQASEATGQSRRVQADLQAAQAAVAAAEKKAQEAAARVAGLEQELQSVRSEMAAAADRAVTTGSVRPRGAEAPASPAEAAPQATAPQTAAPQATAPVPMPRPDADVTGSVPPAQPPAIEGPYRHRRDRWSFAVPPGFRLDSDNDLPGPVNSVLVHEQNRDAVVVVSANGARGACTAQAWYWDNIVEGSRPRRGEVMSDAALPAGDAAFRGFAVRGRGVLQGDRFRTDLDYYDLVAQKRNEPGVVYLVQARFPRAMAAEMIRSVNAMWRDFEVTGPRPYPTRC